MPAPILQDKKLGDLPAHKALLTTFNSSEIVRWAVFQDQYKAEIAAEAEVFSGACTCLTWMSRKHQFDICILACFLLLSLQLRASEISGLVPSQLNSKQAWGQVSAWYKYVLSCMLYPAPKHDSELIQKSSQLAVPKLHTCQVPIKAEQCFFFFAPVVGVLM
jgi:hypothetical protein